MRRSRIALVLLGLVLGALVAATSAFGDHPRAKIVRWDLVEIANGTAVAGGETVATEAATGESITLTGSGHVRPRSRAAFGGGTFVHEDADGNELASGSYHVTRFVSFKRLRGGNFAATGLIDGIGDPDEASSGIMTVKIRLMPDPATSTTTDVTDAVLEVHCHLPQTVQETFEGIRLTIGSRSFEPDPDRHGVTLFHVMR
jgi:hypothetical protein